MFSNRGALGRAAHAAAAYRHAEASVAALHRAGIPIVAGTDANAAPGSPAPIRHGEGLHDELELLVGAGLSPVEALRAATVVPAGLFALQTGVPSFPAGARTCSWSTAIPPATSRPPGRFASGSRPARSAKVLRGSKRRMQHRLTRTHG